MDTDPLIEELENADGAADGELDSPTEEEVLSHAVSHALSFNTCTSVGGSITCFILSVFQIAQLVGDDDEDDDEDEDSLDLDLSDGSDSRSNLSDPDCE